MIVTCLSPIERGVSEATAVAHNHLSSLAEQEVIFEEKTAGLLCHWLKAPPGESVVSVRSLLESPVVNVNG